MDEVSEVVFVFGTLKKGYSNHERYLSGAEFMCEAISVADNYVMQDVGFPTLWQSTETTRIIGDTGCVAGEIYWVSPEQLEACDRLEGNGQMYTRKQRDFRPNAAFGLCVETTAWVYLWNLERTNRPIAPVDGVLVWDRDGSRKIRSLG
jgi:gamma-glutamylcyclotransferase (GGCT)/AIG2-like uncharacterized protein YtfP